VLNSKEKLNNIVDLKFPIFIKPNKLYKNKNVFRGLKLNNFGEFEKNIKKITNFLDNGVIFLVSEFIPGDDTNICSYNAFRNYKGKIIAQWIGKKLTQYPDEFGVFCSASNECSEIVKTQGRKLIEVMDLYGICEPEFKYDYRDNQYKLMEITIRSTMWNRIGYLSGVDVNYQLFLDALKLSLEAKGMGVDKFFENMGQLLLMSHLSEKFN
jgi:predicted ATP-grasp superfamily ATP-dependent carboligase